MSLIFFPLSLRNLSMVMSENVFKHKLLLIHSNVEKLDLFLIS